MGSAIGPILGAIGAAWRNAIADRSVRAQHPAVFHSYWTNHFIRRNCDDQDYPPNDTPFWIIRIWINSEDHIIEKVRMANNAPCLYWLRNELPPGEDQEVLRIRAGGGGHVTLENTSSQGELLFGVATRDLQQDQRIIVTVKKLGVRGTELDTDLWILRNAQKFDVEILDRV